MYAPGEKSYSHVNVKVQGQFQSHNRQIRVCIAILFRNDRDLVIQM